MNVEQFPWEQHSNVRMRVRRDGRYWAIAEPTTWDADDTCEYAARIYYGTFPIRLAEVGLGRGDTMELALAHAIELLERQLPAVEVPLRRNAGSHAWEARANDRAGSDTSGRQFANEWQL
jgi:hypothetical protein